MRRRPRRDHYRVTETGFSLEPELLQDSRQRVSRYWRKFGKSLARRVFAGAGAVVAAGAANFFQRVPDLDTSPPIMPRLPKKGPLAGQYKVGDKRPRTSRDPSSSYVQLRYDKALVGTEIGEVDKLSKLIHSHSGIVIDRFQNVTNINDGTGAYNLSYNSDATYRYFPFYLFDLTCVKNVFGPNSTSDLATPYPFLRLNREVSSGRYGWTVVAGKSRTDTGSFFWQTERTPALYLSEAKERQLFEWFDIKMILYGARACPTWIDVAVVQFTDEEMVPPCIGQIGTTANQVIEPDTSNFQGTVPTTAEYNRWQSSWQGVVDNLVGSTIGQRNISEMSKFMKFKFRKRFTFNPTGSETDPTGHQVQFKLKYLMNKVCDFVGNPNEWDEVPVANEDNPNYWPDYDVHKFSCVPPAKGREFLMIRAFSPVLNGDQLAKNCSFDLMIRRKRTHIRS